MLQIISSHQEYIDRNKANRSFLSMMTKIRATQTLGAVMCDKGYHTRAYDLYKKTYKEMLHDDMQGNFHLQHILKLQNALKQADDEENVKNQAWLLRSNLDAVYDKCISEFNAVESQKPPDLQKEIKNTINSALPDLDAGNHKVGLQKYSKLLKQIKNEGDKLVSPAVMKLVQEAIEIAKASDNMADAAVKIRESLDRVYNEVRLPEVYSPSAERQVGSPPEKKEKKSALVVNFQETSGSMFEYNIQCLDDKVMRGESESQVEICEAEKYLKFFGTVSRVNRAGFASFRIVPTDREEMCKVLRSCKGIIVEVKNLSKNNKRYKFQLANEAHLKSFNWQSEFVVEPNEDFKEIYLDVRSFWPTMFGHVLSSPGNVDFDKVDCMGIILSHVTVDAKENPDFSEGEYGLAVRAIRVVNEE